MSINAIIIDDESDAREVLRELINHYIPEVNILGEASNALEGIKLINSVSPDLVFLDIQMPNGTGFDLLESIVHPKFQTIFTTAHSEYAIKAIKQQAFDYLLKPIDKDDLIDTLTRYKEKQSIHRAEEVNGMIQVPSVGGIRFLKKEEIIYVKSEGNYSSIYLQNGEHFMLSRNLKYVEDLLDKNTFVRPHNSYLVRLDKIVQYNKTEGGSIILENGTEIPISRRRKEELMEHMKL